MILIPRVEDGHRALAFINREVFAHFLDARSLLEGYEE